MTGEPEPLCATFCSAACNAGIRVIVSATEPTASYRRGQVEFCRNDACNRAQLFDFIREPYETSVGVALTPSNLGDGSGFQLTELKVVLATEQHVSLQ